MKYIKTYEKINISPKVGDWCFIDEKVFDIEIVDSFINNSIGYIWKYTGNKSYVFIKYYNIPEELIPYFMYSDYEFGLNKGNSVFLPISKIKHFSKNKEDLETIISQKKFNL